MIHISDSDKAKWDSGSAFKEVLINFPDLGVYLENDEIYSESMSLTEGIFDGNGELSVCGCISSVFSVEVRCPQITPDDELYPSDYLYPGRMPLDFKGQEISVSIQADNSDYLRIFCGYVENVETVRERNYLKLTCYDVLGKYQDVNVYGTYLNLFAGDPAPTVTVKNLRDAVFNTLGISQVSTTLVNDNVVLTLNENISELAAINVIKAICQLNGVFGIINRDKKFEYRQLDYWYDVEPYPSDDLYPGAELYPGEFSGDNHEYIDAYKSLVYEDYDVALIDRVIVRDSSGDAEAGETSSSGNALIIEGNMLTDGMLSTQKTAIANNILSKVYDIGYKPFEGVNRGYPYIEVGDSVSYYSGVERTLISFFVLKRELKGVQWLEDRYTASGAQYQPETKIDGTQTETDSLKNQIKDIKDDISNLYRNKQNYIEKEILAPTEPAEEGDLQFFDVPGLDSKNLYRYENDEWNLVKWIGKNSSPPSAGDDIDVMFENDGEHIVNIWQKNEALWMPLKIAGRHIYLLSEHEVGEWINENDVYERTYKLDSLPSNGSMSYPHGIGGFGLILYARGMRNTNNVFTDLACDNDITVDGTDIILTTNKTQSGTAYITVGYTKPVGGYYPNNQYYAINTGLICTGRDAKAEKTVEGECYTGMVVGRDIVGNWLNWATYCISLLEATAEGMNYHDNFWKQSGTLVYNSQTWYYSYEAAGALATTTERDNTQPPDRRFYIGDFDSSVNDFTQLALTMLLDYIYT